MSATNNTNHLGNTLPEKFLSLQRRLVSEENRKELTVAWDLIKIFQNLASRDVRIVMTAREWMLVNQIITSDQMSVPSRKKVCDVIKAIFQQEEIVNDNTVSEFNRNKIIRNIFLDCALKPAKASNLISSQPKESSVSSIGSTFPPVAPTNKISRITNTLIDIKKEVEGIAYSAFIGHTIKDPVTLNQLSIFLCRFYADPSKIPLYLNAINCFEPCKEKLVLLFLLTFVSVVIKASDLFEILVVKISGDRIGCLVVNNFFNNLSGLFLNYHQIDLARFAIKRIKFAGADEINIQMESKISSLQSGEELKQRVLNGDMPISSSESTLYKNFLLEIEKLAHLGQLNRATTLLYRGSEELNIDHSQYIDKTLPLFVKVSQLVALSNFKELIAIANTSDQMPRKDYLLSHIAKTVAKEGGNCSQGLEIAKKIVNLDVRLQTIIDICKKQVISVQAETVASLDKDHKGETEVALFEDHYYKLFQEEQIRLQEKYAKVNEMLDKANERSNSEESVNALHKQCKRICCDLQSDMDLLQYRLDECASCCVFFKVGSIEATSLPTQWPVVVLNPFNNKPLTILDEQEYLQVRMFYSLFTTYLFEIRRVTIAPLLTKTIVTLDMLAEEERLKKIREVIEKEFPFLRD